MTKKDIKRNYELRKHHYFALKHHIIAYKMLRIS